jgi:hypothetical protein
MAVGRGLSDAAHRDVRLFRAPKLSFTYLLFDHPVGSHEHG